MVICGNHMHKISVSKDMKIKLTMIKGGREHGSREGGGTFTSNTNYQIIQIKC